MRERLSPHQRAAAVVEGLCLSLVLACGDVVGPEALAGTWAEHESLDGSFCTSGGSMTITSSATGFAGEVSRTACATTLGVFRGPRDVATMEAIADGRVSGRNVTFRTPSCSYQGSLSGSGLNRMSGTMHCSEAWGSYSGAWLSSR